MVKKVFGHNHKYFKVKKKWLLSGFVKYFCCDCTEEIALEGLRGIFFLPIVRNPVQKHLG